MKKRFVFALLALLSGASQLCAQTYDVFEMKLGLQASNLPFTESIVFPTAVQNNPITGQINISVNNSLTADGKLLWTIDNRSGKDLQSLEAVTYIDIEIAQAQNTFFNETAKLSTLSLPTTPTPINRYLPSAPVAWQIDEPGYRGGQLNTHYQNLNLASRNALSTNADDIAVAFQHTIPVLKDGERLYIEARIGDQSTNGIQHSDPTSRQDYYLNSIAYTPKALVAPIVTITAPTTSLLATNAITTIDDSTIRVTDDAGVLAKEVIINAATTAGYQDFVCQQTTATQVDCTIVITASGNLLVTATDSDSLPAQAAQSYAITTNPAPTNQPPQVVITAPTTSLAATNTVTTIDDSTIRVTDDAGVLAKDVIINAATTAGYQDFICQQTMATQVDCTIVITASGNLLVTATDSDALPAQATQNYAIIVADQNIQPVSSSSFVSLIILLLSLAVVSLIKSRHYLYFLAIIIGAFSFVPQNLQAATIIGGDAKSQDEADVVLEIVFVTDTSGSVGNAARLASEIFPNIIKNLSCPKKDVYVNAKFLGLYTPGPGIFDEATYSFVSGVRSPDDLEQGILAIANQYPFSRPQNNKQAYVKAIAIMGDTDESSNYQGYYEANQAAVNNDVVVYGILAGWNIGQGDLLLKTASIGGYLPTKYRWVASDEFYELSDTKGAFYSFNEAQSNLNKDIEKLVCGTATTYREPKCEIGFNTRTKAGKVQLILDKEATTNYAVFRSETVDGNYQKIGQIDSGNLFFLDKAVTFNKTYYYQVKELDASQNTLCESTIVSGFSTFTTSNVGFNRAPYFTSKPISTTQSQTLFTYPLSAKDPDNDPINYSLLESPNGSNFDKATNTITWQANLFDVGAFQIKATDDKGASTIQDFEITLLNQRAPNPNNRPPVITSVPYTRLYHQQIFRYKIEAYDPDGDKVYFRFGNNDQLPIHMRIDYTTGVIGPWHPAGFQGEVPIKIIATDLLADTAQEFTLKIGDQKVNNAPYFTSRPDLEITAGIPYIYQAIAKDPEGEKVTYRLKANSIIPTGVNIDSNTGELTWNKPVLGTHKLQLIASDGHFSAEQSYDLIVREKVNLPPKITSQPIPEASIGQPYEYQVVAEDPDSSDLNYRLLGNDIPTGLSISQRGVIHWQYPVNSVGGRGAHTIIVEVSDGQSIDKQTYNLFIRDSRNNQNNNFPPVFTHAGKRIGSAKDSWFVSNPRAMDPDGNTLIFTLLQSPANMTVSPAGELRWHQPQTGTYPILLQVSDGLFFDTLAFDLIILPVPNQNNSTPIINSTPITVATEGEPYAYQVEAIDPEGRSLSYFVGNNTPIEVNIDTNTGLASWDKPYYGNLYGRGRHYIEILVSDGENITSQAYSLQVKRLNQVNQTPIFQTTPPPSPDFGENYHYSAKAVDPEGKKINYYLSGTVPANLHLDKNTGKLLWQNVSPGKYRFVLIASDGIKEAKQYISLNIKQTNRHPIFTSIPVVNGDTAEKYTYTVTAKDPEGSPVYFDLIDNIPTGMIIYRASGHIEWKKPKRGLHDIAIRATDGEKASIQRYQLAINTSNVNHPPQITSTADDSATINKLWQHDVNATDADGDTLTYSLQNAPSGMTINPQTGVVSWTPTSTGSYTLTIVVSDGIQSAEQTFTVTVKPPQPADAKLVKALNWIKSQTQSTGEIVATTQLSTPYQATDEAVRAATLINRPIAANHVRNYLLTADTWLAEHLARKAMHQQSTGASLTPTLTTLSQHYQATTGNYSSFINDSGNLLDTAYVLIAQAQTTKDTAILGYAINYLKSAQLSDGSYRLPKNESSVYVTAKVLQALHRYANYGVSNNVNMAKNYLLAQLRQQHTTLADWELAQTLLALYEVLTDKSVLTDYVLHLKQRQLGNGSFANDVYSTALAIQAIYQFDQ